MNRLHAIVLATVTAAAALAPGAAYAAPRPHGERHVDTAHDVALFDYADDAMRPVVVPTRTTGDILGTNATHAKHAVRMKMRLAGLITSRDSGYGFEMTTAKRRTYAAVLEPVKGSSTRMRAHLEDGHGRKVRCRLTWHVVPSTRTVSVDVPRSCIGRPAWVRVGMGSVAQEGSKLYLDDARTNGTSLASMARFPVKGAKLFH